MTFRADYATLQSAELWTTRNAALVWSIAVPLVSQGTNVRSYHRLLDELAEVVVESMTTALVDRTAFTKPDSMPAVSSPAAVGTDREVPTDTVGLCTIDQVLGMKNSGMSDEQVKRACGK